ncbi:MAG: ClpX C4-type zinc finger protein [Pyrinomonadaceae bacterium]
MIKLRRLCCSFCGKDDTEVLKLVAGPRVYICDGCVAIASRIMDDSHDDNQPPRVQPSVWRKLLTCARRFLRGGAARRVGSFSVSG